MVVYFLNVQLLLLLKLFDVCMLFLCLCRDWLEKEFTWGEFWNVHLLMTVWSPSGDRVQLTITCTPNPNAHGPVHLTLWPGPVHITMCSWPCADGPLHLTLATWPCACCHVHLTLTLCTWPCASDPMLVAMCTWPLPCASDPMHVAMCTWPLPHVSVHMALCTWPCSCAPDQYPVHVTMCTWPCHLYPVHLTLCTWPCASDPVLMALCTWPCACVWTLKSSYWLLYEKWYEYSWGVKSYRNLWKCLYGFVLYGTQSMCVCVCVFDGKMNNCVN